MNTALLLIAHGSRQQDANNDLHHVVASLRGQGRYTLVEPAFLELAEPNIDEAARRCIAQGAARVILVPYFLSSGVHVLHDLHEHRERLASAFPGKQFTLAEQLGRHPLLADIVLQRSAEAEASAE